MIPRAGGPGLAEVASRVWDVVVVGAGPAGSLAARQLALRGLAVLLVDKAVFPREKVCGCCLSGAALGVLERVGLGRLVFSRGARRLERLELAAGRARAELPLGRGAVLSRGELDSALAGEACAAGAVFVDGVLAGLGGPVESGLVSLRRGADTVVIRAGAVAVADGLSGGFLKEAKEFRPRVRRGSRLGVGAILDEGARGSLPGVVSMSCGRGGYVGMVGLEDGRVDVAAALDHGFVRACGGPGVAVGRMLAGAGGWLPGIESARWRGTAALTRRRRVRAGRVFVVGDAAGYVEPFTGEGIAWALASGEAVAPLVAGWLAGEADASSWERVHGTLLGGRHRVCAMVGWGLRRPRLVMAAVRAIGAAPGLMGPLVRAVDRPWAGAGARA